MMTSNLPPFLPLVLPPPPKNNKIEKKKYYNAPYSPSNLLFFLCFFFLVHVSVPTTISGASGFESLPAFGLGAIASAPLLAVAWKLLTKEVKNKRKTGGGGGREGGNQKIA
jgi:hypothetical protein